MTIDTANWNIIGHDWAVTFLARSIASGQDSHAYLITGPPAIGKALLATRIAQALNCEADIQPCGVCRSCRRIEKGSHPDVRLTGMAVQAAGAKADEAARQKELKIDSVRAWLQDVTLRPYEARRRIYMLHDAERLNEEASNALLKNLEEPPPYATLILVANSADLLPTITSRCQVIRLRPLPRQQVERVLLDQHQLPAERAAFLAAWSGGRIGAALRLAAEADELQALLDQREAVRELVRRSRVENMRWAEERAQEYRNGEQEKVTAWLEMCRSWWHDLLLVNTTGTEAITHADLRVELEREARRFDVRSIFDVLSHIDATQRQLRENVSPQLALENLALHLPS